MQVSLLVVVGQAHDKLRIVCDHHCSLETFNKFECIRELDYQIYLFVKGICGLFRGNFANFATSMHC